MEKEVRDFSREELAEEPDVAMLPEDLVAVQAHLDGEELEEEAEGILAEAVEMINLIPVGEGEDLTTPEQVSEMHAVIRQLDMVMWPLLCCKNNKTLF